MNSFDSDGHQTERLCNNSSAIFTPRNVFPVPRDKRKGLNYKFREDLTGWSLNQRHFLRQGQHQRFVLFRIEMQLFRLLATSSDPGREHFDSVDRLGMCRCIEAKMPHRSSWTSLIFLSELIWPQLKLWSLVERGEEWNQILSMGWRNRAGWRPAKASECTEPLEILSMEFFVELEEYDDKLRNNSSFRPSWNFEPWSVDRASWDFHRYDLRSTECTDAPTIPLVVSRCSLIHGKRLTWNVKSFPNLNDLRLSWSYSSENDPKSTPLNCRRSIGDCSSIECDRICSLSNCRPKVIPTFGLIFGPNGKTFS